MKNKEQLTGIVILTALLHLSLFSFSQQKLWSSKINSLKVFIENKGQINIPENANQAVEYVYLGSHERFYFTKSGLIIESQNLSKRKNLSTWVKKVFNNESEEDEINFKKSIIKAEWLNINDNCTIETEGCVEGYFTFEKSKQISNGVNKLIYKNIYPNIDIVYTIPQDSSGIEYSLIVRPGADLSSVSLKYTGDIKKMYLKNGNIEIHTPSGVITEHAPVSFYEKDKKKVTSAFDLKNNIISYSLYNYNASEAIIIDPWVSDISIDSSDIGYNVDYNDSLELYTYIRSSNTNLYVSKYSVTGHLLWTHLITSSTMYEGDFLVEKSSGSVYISEGFNGGGAYVYRINNNGIADGWSSQIYNTFVEIWEMQFDHTSGNIIACGGGTQSNLNGGIINILTGAVNFANFSGFGGICQDIVCGATDYSGKLFVIYSRTICGTIGQIDNRIELVNNTLNGPIWIAPSGYNAFLESSNHVSPVGAQTSNGFNALSVNDNYLYYYDGGGLAVYNKLDGSMIESTSVNLAGNYYMTLDQGGIAADDCDYIYIGGPNSNLLIYKFSGSFFSAPQDMQLGWTGNYSVYDVKYERMNHLLFVSGVNNVGVYFDPIECLESVSSNYNSEEENFKMYPNPVKDHVIIKRSEPGEYKIELWDINGKFINSYQDIKTDEFEINTSDFDKGSYLIKLLNKDNSVIGVKKLVVK